MDNYMVVDAPANYHNKAGGQAFVDGHADIHKWVTPAFQRTPFFSSNLYSQFVAHNNVDREWLQSHSAQYSRRFSFIP